MPLPKEVPHKISTWSAKRSQRRSLKLWMTTDGRSDDGRTPEHGHPISSPCEHSAQVSIKVLQHVYLSSIFIAGSEVQVVCLISLMCFANTKSYNYTCNIIMCCFDFIEIMVCFIHCHRTEFYLDTLRECYKRIKCYLLT